MKSKAQIASQEGYQTRVGRALALSDRGRRRLAIEYLKSLYAPYKAARLTDLGLDAQSKVADAMEEFGRTIHGPFIEDTEIAGLEMSRVVPDHTVTVAKKPAPVSDQGRPLGDKLPATRLQIEQGVTTILSPVEQSSKGYDDSFGAALWGWLDNPAEPDRPGRVAALRKALEKFGVMDPIELTVRQQEELLVALGIAAGNDQYVYIQTLRHGPKANAANRAFLRSHVDFLYGKDWKGEAAPERIHRLEGWLAAYGCAAPWEVPPALRSRFMQEVLAPHQNTFLDRVIAWANAHPEAKPARTDAIAAALRADNIKALGLVPPERHRAFLRGLGINGEAGMSDAHNLFKREPTKGEDGKTTAPYRLICSRCPNSTVVNSGPHGLPLEMLNRKVQQRGWRKAGKAYICPDCVGGKVIDLQPNKDAPMPKNDTPLSVVRADPPRTMTPADRRKVFRAVDDAWDERHARYDGGNTDTTIATALNVPVAWVRDIRVEAFGESQRNADFDKALGDLKNIRAEFARMTASATDLAIKAEKLETECRAILSRLGELKDAE